MPETYIDPTQSTNGSGTELSPRNTPVGLTWLGPDHHVLFKCGTEWVNSSAVSVGTSGAPGQPCVIRPYGSGPKPRIAPSGAASGININNKQYVDILDMDVDSRNSTGTAVFLQQGSTNVNVKRCALAAAASASCVSLQGSSTAAFQQIEVSDCEMLRGGMYLMSGLFTVAGLTHVGLRALRNRIAQAESSAVRLTIEPAGVGSVINSVVMDNNWIRKTGDASLYLRAVYASTSDDTPPALWGIGASMSGNDVADAGTTTTSGAIHMLGVDGFLMERNLVRRVFTQGAMLQGQRRKNGIIRFNDLAGAVAAGEGDIDANGIFADRFDDKLDIYCNAIADCPGHPGVENSGVALAIWMATNVRLWSNFARDCAHGIGAGGNAVRASSAISAFNNTFYRMLIDGFQGDNIAPGLASDGLSLINNLFVDAPIGLNPRATSLLTTAHHNAFVGVAQTYAGSQGAGAGDLVLTPAQAGLVDGRFPMPGSPLLTGGADLGYVRDMYGRQSKKVIGAYGSAGMVGRR